MPPGLKMTFVVYRNRKLHALDIKYTIPTILSTNIYAFQNILVGVVECNRNYIFMLTMFLLRVGMSERRPTCWECYHAENKCTVISVSTLDPMVYDAFICPFVWEGQIPKGYRFILRVQFGVISIRFYLLVHLSGISNYMLFKTYASLKVNRLYCAVIHSWVALKYDLPSDLSRKRDRHRQTWKRKVETYLERMSSLKLMNSNCISHIIATHRQNQHDHGCVSIQGPHPSKDAVYEGVAFVDREGWTEGRTSLVKWDCRTEHFRFA